MTERPLRPGRPQRVRVTGPPRSRATPLKRVGEVDQDTRLGSVYVGSLLREQMWLAVRTLVLVGLTIGLLPLAFALFPRLADTRVAGFPLAWMVLGVVTYPLLLVLGWRYVRRAERNEDAFSDLMHQDDR